MIMLEIMRYIEIFSGSIILFGFLYLGGSLFKFWRGHLIKVDKFSKAEKIHKDQIKEIINDEKLSDETKGEKLKKLSHTFVDNNFSDMPDDFKDFMKKCF